MPLIRFLTLALMLLTGGGPAAAQPQDNIMALFGQTMRAYDEGRYPEALTFGLRALTASEAQHGPMHASVAVSLNNLASVYVAQNRYADAQPLLVRVLKIQVASLGSEHEHVATTLSNIATTAQYQGLYEDAANLHRQALTMREKLLGTDSPLTLVTRANLATLYFATGDYVSAERLTRQTLESLARTNPPDDIALAIPLHNHAAILKALLRYPEAEAAVVRSLTIREKHLPPEHADIAQSLHLLAVIHHVNGRLDRAEPLFQRALRMFEKAMGPDHPQVINTLREYSNLLIETGRADAARDLQRRVEASPGWQAADIPILFATNRKPMGSGYGNEVQTTDADLSLGIATIRAPFAEVTNRAERAAEAVGQLHRSGSGRLTNENSLTSQRVDRLDVPAMRTRAADHLSRAGRFPRQAFVYVHGYNNSFDEALRRTAMIAYDLDFDGLAAVFAWPSKSSTLGYFADRQRADASAPALTEMLHHLAAALPDVTIHLVAHSTGADILLSALEQLSKANRPKPLLGEVIIAHADIGLDRFAETLPSVRKLGLQITSYTGGGDWAVWASNTIRGQSGRVGNTPVSLPGVDSIEVSGLGVRLDFNHNIFVRHPIVFADMAKLMATRQRPPDHRTDSFRPRTTKQGAHWQYQAGKP